MFLGLEICLTAVCLALAYTRPPRGDRIFQPIERHFAAIAHKKPLAVAIVGLLALAIRLALLPLLPIPAPCIHDEFSHLLLADTLAHGRLANPVHPMWIHFETFHVNWHPVYTSMYYPGHALFLALGQVVLGHPFWGVWLSSGLMCAAICWALQGWMPSNWAFLGGLLAMIRLATLSYWADSYWGGTTAALGGALVLGAFPRIKEGTHIRDSIFLGTGMALLALTRPYEGIFYCLPFVIALIFWAARERFADFGALVRRVMFPATLILAAVLGWLSYYFWRVTGSPFTTPYQVNIRTYGLIFFYWEHMRQVPPFHHLMMQNFYRDVTLLADYSFAHQHPIQLQAFKLFVIWLFFFGPLLTVPWIAWLGTCGRKLASSLSARLGFLLGVCAVGYIPMILTIYVGQPHYAAPLTAAFYASTLLVMRELRSTQGGRWLIRATGVLAVFLCATVTVADAFHAGPGPSWIRIWCTPQLQNVERARLQNELRQLPGKHLVIVQYSPNHDFAFDEWVFNDADIDGSKIIWARDMGPDNAGLVNYFQGRSVWLLDPDKHPIALMPYERNASPLEPETAVSRR